MEEATREHRKNDTVPRDEETQQRVSAVGGGPHDVATNDEEERVPAGADGDTAAKMELKFPLRTASLIVLCIAGATVVLWIFAGSTYARYMPTKVPLLVLAWSFGLRHALDADHIAAIDNVTRRLVQDGRAYVTIGTYFSMGHSTIVIVATLLIAALSASIATGFDQYRTVSGIIGSSISASFLFIIATINGISLFLIARDLRRERDRARNAADEKAAAVAAAAALAATAASTGAAATGDNDANTTSLKPAAEADADEMDWNKVLENAGFFTRLFGKRLFRLIDRPYKMYFVGVLFGLGFDTATEVALLSLAALQAVSGDPVWLVLFLPLLFTAGMVLVDTLDGMLMLGAYGWAVVSARTKLRYNLVITATSFIFAMVIALIEVLGMVQSSVVGDDDYKVANSGQVWVGIQAANSKSNFSFIGIALLVSFVVGWGMSVAVFRCNSTIHRLPTEGKVAEEGGQLPAGQAAEAPGAGPLAV
jgi:high-affinity nickel-transport protein